MGRLSYLRDTLPVLSPVEDGPGDAAGVLALQEERLGFAILESEDLAVATDVELTLRAIPLASLPDLVIRLFPVTQGSVARWVGVASNRPSPRPDTPRSPSGISVRTFPG